MCVQPTASCGKYVCNTPAAMCYLSCFADDGVTPDSTRCAMGLTCQSDGTCM
jgi:hypothetical protein